MIKKENRINLIKDRNENSIKLIRYENENLLIY